jgi:sulfur transfer complex TusBCD TusB component (DsrH family)
MKHEKKTLFSEKLKLIYEAVSLLVLLSGVVIGLFNYYTLNQLAPLSTRITMIDKQLQAHETQQVVDFDKLATKQQVIDLTTRVDKISGRVDLLINHLIP